MPLLDWKNEYLIGIDFLDSEHRDLFNSINELYDSCTLHAGAESVEECLAQLHTRLAAHFALEEKAMREMKNPYYPEHKAEHDRFLDEVTDEIADFHDNIVEADMLALAARVNEWIVTHITTYDRKLVAAGGNDRG